MAQQMSGRQRCFNIGARMVTVALVTASHILPSQIEKKKKKETKEGRIKTK